MEKKPFVTKEQLEEIAKTYPTPFYLYDEKGIREMRMKRAAELLSQGKFSVSEVMYTVGFSCVFFFL